MPFVVRSLEDQFFFGLESSFWSEEMALWIHSQLIYSYNMCPRVKTIWLDLQSNALWTANKSEITKIQEKHLWIPLVHFPLQDSVKIFLGPWQPNSTTLSSGLKLAWTSGMMPGWKSWHVGFLPNSTNNLRHSSLYGGILDVIYPEMWWAPVSLEVCFGSVLSSCGSHCWPLKHGVERDAQKVQHLVKVLL